MKICITGIKKERKIMKKQRRRKLRRSPNPEWVVIFKNKRKTKIVLSCFYLKGNSPYRKRASFVVDAVWRGRRGNNDSIPISQGALLLTFSDYNTIISEVLHKDKVARRWFRKTVKDYVIDDHGALLGEFFISGDKLDYFKIQEYEDKVRKQTEKEYYDKKQKVKKESIR